MNGIGDGMYIASSIAKRAHKQDCRYCKSIKKEHQVQYEHTDDAINAGNLLCQYCSPMKARMVKNKEKIECFGSRFKLKYEMKDGILLVNDGLSKWKIYYSTKKRKMIAYHENHIKAPDEIANPAFSGYHRQKVWLTSIMEAFEYISDHFQTYLTNNRLPFKLQNKAKGIFYEQKSKKKNKKADKIINRKRDIWKVLSIIEGLQK